GQHQLQHGLLGAVAGLRRREEVVADGRGEGWTEDRQRRAEDEARQIWTFEPLLADGLQQGPAAVEVDPVAFLEVRLGLARDHGGKVKDDVRPAGDQLLRLAGNREVRYHRIDLAREAVRLLRLHDVAQDDPVDRGAGDP